MLTDGTFVEFHEWETASQTRILGSIASRESHYGKEGLLRGEIYVGQGRKFIQLCGGPTALVELFGLRLLTDPTFDPAGSTYPSPTGAYALENAFAAAGMEARLRWPMPGGTISL